MVISEIIVLILFLEQNKQTKSLVQLCRYLVWLPSFSAPCLPAFCKWPTEYFSSRPNVIF